MAELPDLVRDSKLLTHRCDGRVTVHEIHDTSAARPDQRPQPIRERWERHPKAPLIGEGGFGKVWLEGRRDQLDCAPTVFRAVKEIRITLWNRERNTCDYRRELEAIMKFSQAKVLQLSPTLSLVRMTGADVASTTVASLDRMAGLRAEGRCLLRWTTSQTATCRDTLISNGDRSRRGIPKPFRFRSSRVYAISTAKDSHIETLNFR